MKTNYTKAKIDYMKQNSKWIFCGDTDETVNHTISEYRNLARKEYKTRNECVENVIHW